MAGLNLYLQSAFVQLPSFSAFTSTPRFGKPFKEIGDRPLVWSIRADGNRERPKKKAEDNPQLFDEGRAPLTSNKEEILALFKRIQSSISKGEALNPKKRNPKAADDKSSPSPSAESILEVLHQSTARGKGKTVGKKRDKFVAPQRESWKKEDREEHLSTTRPPSSFTRRSPIPTLSTTNEEIQPESERLPATPSIPRDEIEVKSEGLPATDDDNELKLDEMKLTELKEVAKSRGIKGYSKLKKSELVELLINSP